jgi:hypothetical protein
LDKSQQAAKSRLRMIVPDGRCTNSNVTSVPLMGSTNIGSDPAIP